MDDERRPNGRTVLSAEDVRTIRRRIANGDTQYHIAEDYGVSKQSISNIKHGHTWGWLE
jgi:transcriptional regulator with XRE-family HTH domain